MRNECPICRDNPKHVCDNNCYCWAMGCICGPCQAIKDSVDTQIINLREEIRKERRV